MERVFFLYAKDERFIFGLFLINGSFLVQLENISSQKLEVNYFCVLVNDNNEDTNSIYSNFYTYILILKTKRSVSSSYSASGCPQNGFTMEEFFNLVWYHVSDERFMFGSYLIH